MVILSNDPLIVPKEQLEQIKVEKLLLHGEDYASCRENIVAMMLRGVVSRRKA